MKLPVEHFVLHLLVSFLQVFEIIFVSCNLSVQLYGLLSDPFALRFEELNLFIFLQILIVLGGFLFELNKLELDFKHVLFV